MEPALYAIGVRTFESMLARLELILERADAYASRQGQDSAAWLDARLAPDMFPLARQIKAACDHAKDTAARLAGEQPPAFADEDRTLRDAIHRVRHAHDYVARISAAATVGDEQRPISRPLANGRELTLPALEYLRDWALPQFYFHLVTAYDILRHRGVDLGKRDFLPDIWSAVRAGPA